MSGFESQSLTAGVDWTTIVGSPTIDTATVRSGAAAMRCHPGSAAATFVTKLIYTSAQPAAHVFMRTYIKVATLPSANSAVLVWEDNANAFSGVGLRTDGKLEVRTAGSGAVGSASASAVNDGAWHRIEVDYDDNANTLLVYLDGTQVLSQVANSLVDLSGADRYSVGLREACTADVYFDDAAINDTTGTAQTGLCGAGSIVHLRPAGAGDNSLFETAVGGTAGSANNWTRVAETTPDDATSYNQTIVTGAAVIDDFACGTSWSAGVGPYDLVTLVAVGLRVGSNNTTAAGLVYRLKGQAGGTLLETALISVAVNGWATHAAGTTHLYRLIAYTNPQTSAAWTTAAVDTMQIGYRNSTAQTTVRRAATIWALVEYVSQPAPYRMPTVVNAAALSRAGSW